MGSNRWAGVKWVEVDGKRVWTEPQDTSWAWQELELALRQERPGCSIVVSPRALAAVIAEHMQQGESDED